MWWYRSLIGIVLMVLIGGCGYKLATCPPVVLPEPLREIYLAPVSNPTTYPNLSQLVKNIFLDEFSKRNSHISWTDKSRSKGEMYLEIVDYGSTTSVENAAEETLKLSVCLTLRASLYSSNSSRLVWDSGYVKNCEVIPSSDKEVSPPILHRVVKDTVDKLLALLALKF